MRRNGGKGKGQEALQLTWLPCCFDDAELVGASLKWPSFSSLWRYAGEFNRAIKISPRVVCPLPLFSSAGRESLQSYNSLFRQYCIEAVPLFCLVAPRRTRPGRHRAGRLSNMTPRSLAF